MGGGVLKYKIWYVCAAQCLKIGGLGSGPSLKMCVCGGGGGREKRDFGAKNNKETNIVLKRGSFRSAQVGKTEQRIAYY